MCLRALPEADSMVAGLAVEAVDAGSSGMDVSWVVLVIASPARPSDDELMILERRDSGRLGGRLDVGVLGAV
jgi:hypothetical protein